MSPFFLYLLAYLVVSFALGALWHVVIFKDYYKKLAIYSNIDNPKFSFGLSAMLLQGLVVAYLYPLVSDPLIFCIGLFMVLASFMVFAEAGKQKTTSISGFVTIQIAYSLLQAVLVTAACWVI
jgi:hypothetical protein